MTNLDYSTLQRTRESRGSDDLKRRAACYYFFVCVKKNIAHVVVTFDWPKQAAAIGSDEFEGRTAQLLHRPGNAVAAFSARYRRECQLNVRHCFNRLHQTAVAPPLTRCVASNTLPLFHLPQVRHHRWVLFERILSRAGVPLPRVRGDHSASTGNVGHSERSAIGDFYFYFV